LAKSKPGQLSFASSGNGASSHLAGVLFNNMAGTELMHVPYKGTGPALNDLLGGQVSMTFTDVLTAQQHVRSGKLRALGVTTLARSKALPEIPTISEQGLSGFNVSVFFGIVVPAATPAAIVGSANRAIAAVLAKPDVKETLARQGLEAADNSTPQHLADFMKSEVAKWAEVINRSGAQLD
jgi:tripartite-type tricarboxylate transporter receptor subunit TctC